MRYLGWFRLPGGQRQRTPWITDDGDLDPEELLASELFRGGDVEPISDAVAIPESIRNASDLAAYLARLDWDWPADDADTVILTTPVWAAHTASSAYFLLSTGGLHVSFAPYPAFDTAVSQWAGSPLWAGFLLVCADSADGAYKRILRLAEKERWTLPLMYLSQQRPWLSSDAASTSEMLTARFASFVTQQKLNARRRPFHLKEG